MQERNKISVLMAAYNAAPFIGEAIESILNQTYSNLELLIADDASTDNTVKLIRNFNDSRIKLYNNEKNIGHVKTHNKLMLLAEGDFVTFQDADDYSELSRLELQMKE